MDETWRYIEASLNEKEVKKKKIENKSNAHGFCLYLCYSRFFCFFFSSLNYLHFHVTNTYIIIFYSQDVKTFFSPRCY